MANDETKKKDTKSSKTVRGGTKLGGDEHPTFTWGGAKSEAGASIKGRLTSLSEVRTRYGVRARLCMMLNELVVAETADGEVVPMAAGSTVGIWMPERYSLALKPALNQVLEIFRDIDGTQIRYDPRLV
jgi:hypothetical protein